MLSMIDRKSDVWFEGRVALLGLIPSWAESARDDVERESRWLGANGKLPANSRGVRAAIGCESGSKGVAGQWSRGRFPRSGRSGSGTQSVGGRAGIGRKCDAVRHRSRAYHQNRRARGERSICGGCGTLATIVGCQSGDGPGAAHAIAPDMANRRREGRRLDRKVQSRDGVVWLSHRFQP